MDALVLNSMGERVQNGQNQVLVGSGRYISFPLSQMEHKRKRKTQNLLNRSNNTTMTFLMASNSSLLTATAMEIARQQKPIF